MASQYLSHDNLHFKPICARVGRGVLWATTTLQCKASTTQWHGHVVRFLSKAVLFVGAFTLVPLALIEAVCLFTIAGVGVVTNKFLCKNRSAFLQKYSLKALSYAIHSSALTAALFILGLKNPNLRYHTANALIDHAIHLGTAAFTQSAVGPVLDRAAGRDPNLAISRTLNLLQDSHPTVLNDVLTQIQRDFDLHLRERMRQVPHLQTYLHRHPEDRDFVRDFNFRTLFQDRPYRQRTGEFIHRFLEETQLVLPVANQDQANALYYEFNQNTAGEAAYQESLARHLKVAFLEIHRTPTLSHYLDKDSDQGKDLLEMMDASTYVPLTVYTQYKELLEPITCPKRFSGHLTRYNQRHPQLVAAKQQVDALSAKQRVLLVQKILRGSDFQTQGPIKEAYLSISSLAPALYQGPLMTKTAIDLRSLAQGGGGNLIDVRNLFQKACQEAIAEIGQAAPLLRSTDRFSQGSPLAARRGF